MRRTPEQIQRDIERHREWQKRTREKALKKLASTSFAPRKLRAPSMRPRDKKRVIKSRSDKRQHQESYYHALIPKFLEDHPICPVTGERTNQIHRSAKREGAWLLLRRYWIAVSAIGHRWIEDNAKEAATLGLMVRIFVPYSEHVRELLKEEVDIVEPVFYKGWDGNILVDKSKLVGYSY